MLLSTVLDIRHVSNFRPHSSDSSLSSMQQILGPRHRFLRRQVEVHHLGTVTFSGVSEPQAVAHILSGHLAARGFPAIPPSRKATLVEPPRGLLATVVVRTHNPKPFVHLCD